MLEDERHLARAHFQHRARALPAGAGIAETGIEEAGVMHAEFADQRIERHHLGGIVRRHLHGFLGREDVEFAGIEDEPRPVGGDRLPEFVDAVAAAAIDIDHAGVTLGAIADEAAGVLAGEIDRQRDAAGRSASPASTSRSASCSASSASASSRALPGRKRICVSREPSRTSTGNVRGLISV